jgi:hypothetical protein
MIKKFGAILFMCGFLCSIAVCQDQKEQVLPASRAKLVFYRVTGFPGRDVHASIKIDGEQPVHKISNLHSWATDIAVGPHLIFGDDQRYGRTYMLEGGKTYYFRVDAIPPSMTKGIRFRVIKVPADLADAEMTGLDAD